MAAGEYRLRLVYRKTGRLRFLSHLEVMRAIERGARRAGLPYAVTQGFNPHMKVAFGPALPVGTAGLREYVDMWLREHVPAAEVVQRLSGVLLEDLGPVEARYVCATEPSLSAACTVAVYEVVVAGQGIDEDTLSDALADVIRVGTLVVEHREKHKVFDLARSLPKEPRARSSGSDVIVDVTTHMGPDGSLRPDALLEAALSRIGGTGAIRLVTRMDAFVEDEGAFRRPI